MASFGRTVGGTEQVPHVGSGVEIIRHYEVEAIRDNTSDPQDRLYRVIIAFLRQEDPKPTWRAIVDALRSRPVNLPALARRVEDAHFPATARSSPQDGSAPHTSTDSPQQTQSAASGE